MYSQFLITVLFLFFSFTSSLLSGQNTPDLINKIDSIFADMSDMEKPGAVLTIMKGDQIILSRAYGSSNLYLKTPYNENTLFPLMNFTDQLVAFSVLQLERKKRIKLSDPINQYLPNLGFKNNVTIDHLLNHSSGLPLILSLRMLAGWKYTDPISQDEFLRLTKSVTSDIKPDEKIGHSHAGIRILQMLVEKVSGNNFSDYATANIFSPLGMNQTVIGIESFGQGRHHAVGYETENDKYKRVTPIELEIMCPKTYTTQGDFQKWMLNVQTKKFEKDIIEKMDDAYMLNEVRQKRSNNDYCVGQQQYYLSQGNDEFFFGDVTDGFTWNWRRLKQSEISIMALSNNETYIGPKISAIVRLMIPPVSNTGNTASTLNNPVSQEDLSVDDLDEFAGSYWNETYFYTTKISVVDGALHHADNDNGFVFTMERLSKNLFRTPFGGTVEFKTGLDGQRRFINILPLGSVYESVSYNAPVLSRKDQERYEGLYESVPLNIIYSVVFEEGELKIKRSRKTDLILSPIGQNKFRSSEIDFRVIEFQENVSEDQLMVIRGHHA